MPLASFSQMARMLAAALLLCGLASCSSGKVIKAHPALWVVRDSDSVIYLLGTMHALPARTDWDDGPVEQAITSADTLVMELSPDEIARAPTVMQKLSSRQRPMAMRERLTPDQFAQYYHLTTHSGLSGSNGDTLDDWAITLAMGNQAATRAGLTSDAGVETGLIARFQSDSKPIKGLETARGQLMMFENLPPRVQREMLTEAIRKSDTAVEDVHRLVRAWSNGEVDRIHALIADDVSDNPQAMQSIYTDRNIRWTQWVVKRLDTPGTVLLAVGAGHLAGPEGLPERLARQGVSVRRLQ